MSENLYGLKEDLKWIDKCISQFKDSGITVSSATSIAELLKAKAKIVQTISILENMY
jgi:hypothetical protein